MSQTALTSDQRIMAIRRLGYDGHLAEFACQAALHGGHFVPRQFHEFHRRFDSSSHTQSTQALAQLLDQLFANGHGTALVYCQNEPLYRISGRAFYAALGQDDNRNRRERQPSTIKQKLMGFDYVLAHPSMRFLATEKEKLEYFCDRLGLPTDVLPCKTYAANAAVNPTRRYFVEKYPIAITDSAAGEPVSFCFVDEGLTTGSHFETFLGHYWPLLESLGNVRVRVIYVAARPSAFRMAEKVFAARARQRTLRGQTNRELLLYFDLRRRFETKQSGLDRAALLALRDARQAFAGANFEAQFSEWNARQERPSATESNAQIQLETYLLEHRYDLFGTLTA